MVAVEGRSARDETTNQTKKMSIEKIQSVISDIESTVQNGDFTESQKQNVHLCLCNARIYAEHEKIHSVIYVLTSALIHTVGVFHPLYSRAVSLNK